MTSDTGAVARIVEGQKEIRDAMLAEQAKARDEVTRMGWAACVKAVEMCIAVAEAQR